MRDPKRIDEFCDTLKEAWHKVPDWRFGQLVSNLPLSGMFFYIEDDEVLAAIRQYFAIPDKDSDGTD